MMHQLNMLLCQNIGIRFRDRLFTQLYSMSQSSVICWNIRKWKLLNVLLQTNGHHSLWNLNDIAVIWIIFNVQVNFCVIDLIWSFWWLFILQGIQYFSSVPVLHCLQEVPFLKFEHIAWISYAQVFEIKRDQLPFKWVKEPGTIPYWKAWYLKWNLGAYGRMSLKFFLVSMVETWVKEVWNIDGWCKTALLSYFTQV